MDFLSFVVRVGLPLFSYEDVAIALSAGKAFLGTEPRPTGNRERVERYVYEELAQIARANGVKVCIVILGSNSKPVDVLKGVLPADAIVVNAHAALLAQLTERNDLAYSKQYALWRGSPPVFVDEHPNARAHRIIAEKLVAAIQANAKGSPRSAQ